MVTLQTVTVPGYAEAVRKEQNSRALAFLAPYEVICGVKVAPVSLRLILALEVARNGFVVPCVFDNAAEAQAHGLQVLYFASQGFHPEREATFWGKLVEGWRRQRFIARTLRSNPGELSVANEVKAWMEEAFMDAPKGDASGAPSVSYAAYPAYIIDTFAEAGLRFTYDEIMEMPLKRLWQHQRVALKRQNPKYALANPSDKLFTDAIAPKS